jgi:biopolymer transport protein ExbD
MRFKRIKEDEPMMGITPLIDIVFLLLIFFMLTSHFHVASGVPIRLPKVTQNAYGGKKQEIIVAIDKTGGVYLKGKKIEIGALGPRLKELLDKDGLAKLVLQADKEVHHGKVVQVMDLAKSAGISSIVIAAQWNSRKAD